MLAVAATQLDKVVFALEESQKSLNYFDTILISPKKPKGLPKTIKWKQSPPLPLRGPGHDAYSRFMIFDLWRYVESSHCLTIHADGYVLNPRKWSSTFLEYDYIGAPWPLRDDVFVTPFGRTQRVGNGGFSLRSKKLLRVPQQHEVVFDVNKSDFYRHMNAGLLHEDGNICVHNRHVYEYAGCRFAPVEIAVQFSQEHFVNEARWIRPFGFHRQKPRFWRNFFPADARRAFSAQMSKWSGK
jgi:hypothetical protein